MAPFGSRINAKCAGGSYIVTTKMRLEREIPNTTEHEFGVGVRRSIGNPDSGYGFRVLGKNRIGLYAQPGAAQLLTKPLRINVFRYHTYRLTVTGKHVVHITLAIDGTRKPYLSYNDYGYDFGCSGWNELFEESDAVAVSQYMIQRV